MNTLAIAIAVKLAVASFVPGTCSAPRDIGGGMTVRTCEISKPVAVRR